MDKLQGNLKSRWNRRHREMNAAMWKLNHEKWLENALVNGLDTTLADTKKQISKKMRG